jgi:hypothetical protein
MGVINPPANLDPKLSRSIRTELVTNPRNPEWISPNQATVSLACYTIVALVRVIILSTNCGKVTNSSQLKENCRPPPGGLSPGFNNSLKLLFGRGIDPFRLRLPDR